MLRKLLKYDIRAISRFFWIGAVVSVAGSVVGALLMRFFLYTMENETEGALVLFALLAMIASVACIIGVILSFVFTVVLVYVRFYRHFFTDEGYLTFTLHVKRSTLFLSKKLNAMIWLVSHAALLCLCVLLFAVLVTPSKPDGFIINFSILTGLGHFFALSWDAVGAWLLVYLLEAVLLFVVYLLFSVLLVYFCITVGAVLAKRAKVLVAIGIYYAITSTLSVVTQFGVLLVGVTLTEGIAVLSEDGGVGQAAAAYAFLVLAVFAAISAVAFLLYALTQRMLDRKLNLA